MIGRGHMVRKGNVFKIVILHSLMII